VFTCPCFDLVSACGLMSNNPSHLPISPPHSLLHTLPLPQTSLPCHWASWVKTVSWLICCCHLRNFPCLPRGVGSLTSGPLF
jgi:hypothetical protein